MKCTSSVRIPTGINVIQLNLLWANCQIMCVLENMDIEFSQIEMCMHSGLVQVVSDKFIFFYPGVQCKIAAL